MEDIVNLQILQLREPAGSLDFILSLGCIICIN